MARRKKTPITDKNLSVVNLSGYEVPTIKEERFDDFVRYGDDNDYFDTLIERYMGSPTNSRCINGITDMVYGRGLEAADSKYNEEAYAKMKTLLKGEEVQKIAHDFYMLGMASAKVYWNSDKTKILKVWHHPMETLRAGKADSKGKIGRWYYHPSWKDYVKTDKLKSWPSFGNGGDNERIEIFILKPYRSGFYYYAPVAYQGCLQYAQLEEEVSNYHLMNISNGLAPSLFINFNNGIPDENTQSLIEQKIYKKFSGTTNAGKAIISFNEDKETASTIEPIHLPDAHAQYQFLSDEAREKIMLGHGIVSPILLGIKDNTGFGNNAEELRTASILMDNIVIRPLQETLIRGFEQILIENGISLKLYFVTLQPIEFTELDNIATKIKREEETGEKLSAVDLVDFDDEQGNDLLDQLKGLGEKIDDSEWELVHTEKLSDPDTEIKMSDLPQKRGFFARLFGTTPQPNEKSVEDDPNYKVRYAYAPVRNSSGSRDFCVHMEGFTDNNIVFRKEDINQMSFRGVNREHGHKGMNYSLLKYKGGRNCKHYWELRVYKRLGGQEVSETTATNDGLEMPTNPPEMEVRPHDMPNGGAYPK